MVNSVQRRAEIEPELIGAAFLDPKLTLSDLWAAYSWQCPECECVSEHIYNEARKAPSVTPIQVILSLPETLAVQDAGGREAFAAQFTEMSTPSECVVAYLDDLIKRAAIEKLEGDVKSILAATEANDPVQLTDRLRSLLDEQAFTTTSDYESWPILSLSEAYVCDSKASYLVKGLLAKGDLGAIYGPSASGKSFFATDLGLAIARGTSWRGHRVNNAGVAYVVAEGATGFDKRLEAYKHVNDVHACNNFQRIVAAPNLIGPASQATKLIQSLKLARSRMDDDLGVVFLDTLARVIPGQNENAFETMGALVDVTGRIARELGATVILVHHTGKDAERGMRGHSSLFGACDTVIEVSAPSESGETAATVRKQKDGEQGASYGFRLNEVHLGYDSDGDALTSCVVEPCDPPVAMKSDNSSGHSQRAIAALKQACANGSSVCPDTATPLATINEWRDAFRALDDISSLKADTANAAFRRAKEQLVYQGRIVELSVGFTLRKYLPKSDAALDDTTDIP